MELVRSQGDNHDKSLDHQDGRPTASAAVVERPASLCARPRLSIDRVRVKPQPRDRVRSQGDNHEESLDNVNC
jgi:hypothetical protein